MTDNTPPTQTEPQPKGVAATFREAFQRARESRPNRPSRRKPAEELGESERSARNRDLANRLLSTLRESSGLCDLDFDNVGFSAETGDVFAQENFSSSHKCVRGICAGWT